jgi:hypothetical protein
LTCVGGVPITIASSGGKPFAPALPLAKIIELALVGEGVIVEIPPGPPVPPAPGGIVVLVPDLPPPPPNPPPATNIVPATFTLL